jgi:hypothetical protein
MIHNRRLYSTTIKCTKNSVSKHLFISQGHQLRISAKLYSHHEANFNPNFIVQIYLLLLLLLLYYYYLLLLSFHPVAVVLTQVQTQK